MYGSAKTTDSNLPIAKEKELIFIKDHPDRARRRSSVPPMVPAIKEERILEDLCGTTNIEPEVPGNTMKKRDINRLIRSISISDEFTSRFRNEDEFLEHVRKLSDPTSISTPPTTSRKGRQVRSQILITFSSYQQDIKLNTFPQKQKFHCNI